MAGVDLASAGWRVAGRGTGGPAAAHLVGTVGAVLVHSDALGAALHLGLPAAVGWVGTGQTTEPTSRRPGPPHCSARGAAGLSPVHRRGNGGGSGCAVCPGEFN